MHLYTTPVDDNMVGVPRDEDHIMSKTDYNLEIKKAIDHSEVIEDFLPPPDQLVFREDNIKVTLDLSKRSVRLFKRYAKKRGLKYQRMIRNLIDLYADKKLST